MEDNINFEAILVNDVINSLALTKAREAGFIDENTDLETIGTLGGALTDTTSTTLMYLSGSIDSNTAREKIKSTIKKVVKLGAEKIADFGIDRLADLAKVHFPTFSKIIDIGKEIVKQPILKAVGKLSDTIAEPIATFATKAVSNINSFVSSAVSTGVSLVSSAISSVTSWFGFK